MANRTHFWSPPTIVSDVDLYFALVPDVVLHWWRVPPLVVPIRCQNVLGSIDRSELDELDERMMCKTDFCIAKKLATLLKIPPTY